MLVAAARSHWGTYSTAGYAHAPNRRENISTDLKLDAEVNEALELLLGIQTKAVRSSKILCEGMYADEMDNTSLRAHTHTYTHTHFPSTG